ncbi:MAG: peptidoglycan-associated lipoprotein Pal [Candidatus Aminicenantia bacterium]
MKKLIILLGIFALLVTISGCKKKVEVAPPPPPQKAEKKPVSEPEKAPTIKEPELTEEEIFRMKSIEELNREAPLKRIHFDFDKYFIRDDQKPTLEGNAEWLKKFSTVKILIEGHCDERGTEEYNMALGEKRAKSTMNYLISLGISPERIKIISYGKSRPLDPGHNEEAWSLNRRAEFVIIEK